MLQKVELGSTLRNIFLQLATLKFVAWQKVISEMPQASVLKRGQVQNLVKIIFYYHANKTHFHKKGFALGLVLRVRVF